MQSYVALVALLACAPLLAATDSTATTDWSGSGMTNGWSYTDLSTPYRSDGAPIAVQFGRGGATIASPSFSGDIVRIDLALRSSTNPIRPLLLTPINADGESGAQVSLEPPNSERPLVRSVEFPRTRRIRAFRLTLGSGASGNWGLYSVQVSYLRDGEVSVPQALHHARPTTHRLYPAWELPADAADAELRVVTTNAVPFSASYADTLDFSALTNAARQSRELTELPPALASHFSGDRLYLPPGSTGELTVGSSDYAGRLVYAGRETYAGLTLVLHARRFPSRDEGTLMPLSWIAGDRTNDLAMLTLTDDYADFPVPLGVVPDRAQLVFHSTTNRATRSGANGRVVVDRIGFATDVSPARTETNDLVRTRMRGNGCVVSGLPADTAGLWSVRAVDADGRVSAFADYVPFRTSPAPYAGTTVRLR